MYKKIILGAMFIFLFSAVDVQATLGSILIVNDFSKKCQAYSPSSTKELLPGWHTPPSSGPMDHDLYNNFEKRCDLLGYTMTQGEQISIRSEESILREALSNSFLIVLALLIYIYIRILYFIKIKKSYKIIIFILCITITTLILSSIVKTLIDMIGVAKYPDHSSFFQILFKNIKDLKYIL
jgi:hypothetical protein